MFQLQIVEEVASVSPSNLDPGQTIPIAGFGFVFRLSVDIGGTECVISQSSSNEIICTVANQAGTYDVTVGSSNSMSVTVDSSPLSCSIDSSYSPVYTDFVAVTCNMALTNVIVFLMVLLCYHYQTH